MFRFFTSTTVFYRALSRDVTAAILVFQNKETAAILVYRTTSLEAELYFESNIKAVASKRQSEALVFLFYPAFYCSGY